ncbi:SCO family protein [Lacinutrix sp. C3R15]|uniref:SCO family protein n=1 Tax=Flavobacteriaceae TaxID=49546 RepID=UPI001C09C105|nr:MULTISPECIES: SCO family protein [Flavobacteriaceae]MBU2940060.1 SCO family protein [Lacinutrix sp. C3R15]MDO6623377.1 SCO family protein [Oceanihabitans sp. 1_MG-2023]
MSKKSNYSYIGIALTILVFGIIFIPKIVDRVTNKDITREESRSVSVSNEDRTIRTSDLAFLEINGQPKKVPDFSFKNQDGKTISNKDYLGKVYVIEFFFTTCPTICPRMSRNLVDIQNTFPDNKNFGVASFTINPAHDTSEVLKDYAKKYGITNPNWHLMTGDQEVIYDLANKGFNLYTAEEAEVEGGFEHSGNFALVDKNGFIRSRLVNGNPIIYYNGMISEEEQVDDEGQEQQITMLKEDINKLLNE